ncbi:MAG: hypothetical protein DRH17_14020 [Deltaproteobacteria bacterium]|nr:MAG: hypothetical protein DRH17_14020 [Deltaproteobacteria bacterium]
MCEQIIDPKRIKELANKILDIIGGELRVNILYALAGVEAEVHSGALKHCIEATGDKVSCIAGFIDLSAELYAKMIVSVLLDVLGIKNIKKPDAIII